MHQPARRQRRLTVLVFFFGIAASFWGASAGIEDVTNPQQRVSIEEGVRLERSRQWRDAIDHYHENLKLWPDSRYLQYGLRRSQIHFSIDRRYADGSFRDRLAHVSREQALSMYDDVLTRIRTYFVDPISTTSIVAHGTESLWLSLANHKFLDQNLFGVDPDALREVRTILHENYWNREVHSQSGALELINEVCDLSSSRLGLPPTAVIMEYVFGACNCLDDYSHVLTPGRLDDLYSNMEGEFVGIGIVMEAKVGKGLRLVNVLPSSPAAESGLRPGEHITAIDGQDCRFLTTDEAAGLLTGRSGTQVRLAVENFKEASRDVTCVRREVKVYSIPVATMIDQDASIGYIRMTGFQKSTASELDAALAKLSRQGMRSLVWDLRGNPGGLLTAAVEVLDRFIAEGRLVSTRGRMDDQNMTYSAHRSGTWSTPLVLLIDENSASASEIVAGAIRDHKRGVIVGRRSFGKWSVQSIYPTLHSAGLRITTAKFYSPNGHSYERTSSFRVDDAGLVPDITVEVEDESLLYPGFGELDPNTDPDISRAISVLKQTELTHR